MKDNQGKAESLRSNAIVRLSAACLFFFVFASPLHAQPSCAAYLCFQEEGETASSQCMQHRIPYFLISIWTPTFNDSATSAARSAFMQTCTSAEQDVLDEISDSFGEVLVDPMTTI